MNINHNTQEPPRKRSRDQQHSSNQPISSTSMIDGTEKGSNKDDRPSSTAHQPSSSSGSGANIINASVVPTLSQQHQITPPTTNTTATSSAAPPWSWFRRHHRQHAHQNPHNHGQQASSSHAGQATGATPSTNMSGSVPSTIGSGGSGSQTSGLNSSTNANIGNSNPVDATSGMGNIPSFTAVSMVTSDAEDEAEMSRLQAILEARGVPSHLLGALAPRVQTLLHRTIGSSSSSKAHQLVQGLKAHGDEGQQLQTVMEMCQLLVMGNEDTLAGFPVKLAVPNLIQLLNMEHNFDIMNHACRALTYMMESLPRSASVVVDAVPSFLEKLQVIQCMDVAEQSLTALEMLSRRHSRAILHARGVPACLTYLDFFSINAQRSALTIAANCCQNITPEEFKYIQDSLVTLSSHLASTDKKCIESIVLAFSRLVEHYQVEPSILMEVAGDNLLDNLSQLLLATPSGISINTFVMIIRMMALMCQSCPELAVRLLSSDIVSTIRYLLVGQKLSGAQAPNRISTNETSNATINASSTSLSDSVSSNASCATKLNESVELLNRTPQELFELTSLIAELMPRLPNDGLFSIDKLLSRDVNTQQESVTWSWRDDRGNWHRYNNADNKIIEGAHRAGEEEVTLITMGKTYTIDFTTMQQINEETDLSRPVQRKVNHHQQSSASDSQTDEEQSKEVKDHRAKFIETHPGILENFVSSLFGVLYEIYSSSAGPSVRHKCLRALLRIIYYSPINSLRHILKDHPVSSHIAAMLGSADQRILVGAIQMATILMDKLPDIFSVYFRREGVVHQFKELSNKMISDSTLSSSSSSNQKQEIRDWIVKQALNFEERTNSTVASNSQGALDVLGRLTCALEMLDDNMFEALQQLKAVLSDGDISSFELIHSGLVSKLVQFLTHMDGEHVEERDDRIRAFLATFLGLPQDPRHLLLLLNEFELKMDPVPMLTLVSKLNACISQLEQFPVRVHDFVGLGSGSARGASALKFFNTHQLKCNLQRHPSCSNLRQWKGGPVKIDPLAIVQAIEKYLTVRGYAKIRDSADNSDDNSGDDLDDSMNMMSQSTGRHRLQLSIGDQVLPYNMTVYQAIRQFGNSSLYGSLDGDENDLQVVGSSNMWTETHTIYYRPYVESQPSASSSVGTGTSTTASASTSTSQVNMPKRISRSQAAAAAASVGSLSASSGASDLRVNVNLECDANRSESSDLVASGCTAQQATSSGRRYNTRNSSSSLYSSHYQRTPVIRKKVDDLWSEGRVPPVSCPLDPYLSPKLPQSVTLKDPSMEIIVLLRTLFELNRHWSWFYRDYISFNTHRVIGNVEFINTKLAAKATRQLQDPLVIMTGNLPNWLPQLAYACPFLIPFDTRQLLFYVTCFDRDRALQRLLDTTPGLNNSEERVAPRLEKRKKTVNREDLFRQAEIILNELTNSKTVLEIQYENEVGTGLGPTLEFYALVSREMQCSDLEMWRGEAVPASQPLLPPDDQANIKDQASTSIMASDSYQDDWKKGDSFVCMEDGGINDPIRGNNASNNNIYAKSGSAKVAKNASYKNQYQKAAAPMPPPIAQIPSNEPTKKYMYSAHGLFPMPLARNTKLGNVSRIRNRYKLLGKFMAKALMDSRMIDINFSLPFYKWLLSQDATLDLADMVHIDPTMSRSLFQMHRIAQLYNIMLSHRAKQASSSTGSGSSRAGYSSKGGSYPGVITTAKSMDKLRQQVGQQTGGQSLLSSDDIFGNISPEVLTLDGCPIEDLNLDFTLPGYSSIELKKGGKYIQTKLDNLDQYVKILRHWTLSEGVRRQMEAFKAGFESIVPLHYLRIFYPEELNSLFCGTGFQSWDVRMLMDACKTDHGFTHESIQIKYLFEILSSYNADEQRKFLQFVTGSPRLPYGGLKSLSPPLTIVRKTLEPGQNPDHFLPSVMTCVNYLKLPEYSSSEIMREKLRISGEEGRNSFHLS